MGKDGTGGGQACECSIDGVLSYYNEKVTRYLSLAVVEADVFPREILNEIRSSYTHLSKANAAPPESDDFIQECANAMRHLKRTSLDCLKVAILFVAKRVDDKLDALTTRVRLPQKMYARAEDLRAERLRLVNYEAAHPSHRTVADLEELYAGYANFLRELNSEYDGTWAEAIATGEKKRETKALLQGIALGVLTSLFASMIFAIVW